MNQTTPFSNLRRLSRWTMAQPLRALATGLVLLTAGTASAQGYPDKSKVIKIVVPTGPGSALDLLARTHSKAMSESAGLNVIVDNKPGAESVLGIQTVLSSPADGYTMLLLSSSMVTLNPVMIPKLPYDPLKDLVPISTISKAGLVMSLGSGVSFKTTREFIAAAKAAPGKYTCATASTTLRMACEFLQASAGIKLLIVPYKTTAAAMLALASGEADVLFADAGSMIPHWKTGRVRGVMSTTAERMAGLPQLPTSREEGMPDFLMSAWYAFYFPAGTAPAVVHSMRDILSKAGESQTVKDALHAFVHEPLRLSGSEITAMTRAEIDTWRTLVRTNNIKIVND